MVSTPLSFVAVAQLVEHQISTLRVASSILVSDSKTFAHSTYTSLQGGKPIFG